MTSLVSGRLSGASKGGRRSARGGFFLTSRANSPAHEEEQQTTLTKAIPFAAQPPGGIQYLLLQMLTAPILSIKPLLYGGEVPSLPFQRNGLICQRDETKVTPLGSTRKGFLSRKGYLLHAPLFFLPLCLSLRPEVFSSLFV